MEESTDTHMAITTSLQGQYPSDTLELPATQPILSGATAVVENNLGRKKKNMFTERERTVGGLCALLGGSTRKEQRCQRGVNFWRLGVGADCSPSFGEALFHTSSHAESADAGGR